MRFDDSFALPLVITDCTETAATVLGSTMDSKFRGKNEISKVGTDLPYHNLKEIPRKLDLAGIIYKTHSWSASESLGLG